MRRRPPAATLFPYTTLFRSRFGERDEVKLRRIAGAFLQVDLEDRLPGLGRGEVHKEDLVEAALAEQFRGEGLDVVGGRGQEDRKSTRLNSSHVESSYAVFCL